MAFIDVHRDRWSLAAMCRVLEVLAAYVLRGQGSSGLAQVAGRQGA